MNPLNKLPYSKLDSKNVGIKEGVVFLTYNSLIASSEKGRSRLQQLVQWCGPEFDGLLIFDEVAILWMMYIKFFALKFSSPFFCELNNLSTPCRVKLLDHWFYQFWAKL